MNPEKLLTVSDLAEALGCSKMSIYRALRAGKLPPPSRVTGHPRWTRSDLERAIAAAREPQPA